MKHYWLTSRERAQSNHDCEKLRCRELDAEDILAMQTIDADCNDCGYFKRGEMIKGPGLTSFRGHCLKFDKPTRAYPMQYTGHECFEHRRAI